MAYKSEWPKINISFRTVMHFSTWNCSVLSLYAKFDIYHEKLLATDIYNIGRIYISHADGIINSLHIGDFYESPSYGTNKWKNKFCLELPKRGLLHLYYLDFFETFCKSLTKEVKSANKNVFTNDPKIISHMIDNCVYSTHIDTPKSLKIDRKIVVEISKLIEELLMRKGRIKAKSTERIKVTSNYYDFHKYWFSTPKDRGV